MGYSAFPDRAFPNIEVVYPAAADVESGVEYGDGGDEFTGTFTEPGVGNVESAVTYGGGGTEFTGTFGVPAESDVAKDVTYGAAGTEFTGTKDDAIKRIMIIED